MTDWRDLFSDTEKIQVSLINGMEIPWKKLSVEQDMLLNSKYKNDEERLIREKILARMQNADNSVTETDLIKLPEDVFMKLMLSMAKILMGEREDFLNGVSQKSPKQSTGSSNTADTDSTKQDTSPT